MSEFPPLLRMNKILLYVFTHLVCPFIHQWTLGFLPPLLIANNASWNMSVLHLLLITGLVIDLGCIFVLSFGCNKLKGSPTLIGIRKNRTHLSSLHHLAYLLQMPASTEWQLLIQSATSGVQDTLSGSPFDLDSVFAP